MSFGAPPQGAGGGGAKASDIWSYPTRTLTEYKRIAEVIKNKDYSNARPEDYIYAPAAWLAGLVTLDELAAFIDGADPDIYARIFDKLPAFVWDDDIITDILNNDNMSPTSINNILKSAHISADRAQAILYRMVDRKYFDKIIDILTYDAGDATITADTTISSPAFYKTLTINSGVTLSVDKPGIIVARSISLNGVIKSGWVKGAGGAPGYSGAGAGGDGAGGLIIITKSIDGSGSVSADGGDGGNATRVDGDGDGQPGGDGYMLVIGDDSPGTGGNGGYKHSANTPGSGNPNGGGGGGDTDNVKIGGDGGSVTLSSYSTGLDLLLDLFKSIIDWYLINKIGKTPTTYKNIPEIGGAGGGGGCAIDGYDAAGGGGGGGGEIILYSTTLGGTLNMTARGGRGGDAGTEGLYDCAGGGGGGGIIYVFYSAKTGTISYDVSGGAAGTGGDGIGQQAGSAGVYREVAV